MADHMLSTSDNPYNPFTEWPQWYSFDQASGYNTTAYLGRIVRTSDELSPADQSQAIEDAIDEIVSENVLGIYIKVKDPSSGED